MMQAGAAFNSRKTGGAGLQGDAPQPSGQLGAAAPAAAAQQQHQLQGGSPLAEQQKQQQKAAARAEQQQQRLAPRGEQQGSAPPSAQRQTAAPASERAQQGAMPPSPRQQRPAPPGQQAQQANAGQGGGLLGSGSKSSRGGAAASRVRQRGGADGAASLAGEAGSAAGSEAEPPLAEAAPPKRPLTNGSGGGASPGPSLWYKPPRGKSGSGDGGASAPPPALDVAQLGPEPASWQARGNGAPLPFVSVPQADLQASIELTFPPPLRIRLPGSPLALNSPKAGLGPAAAANLARRWPPASKPVANVLVVSAALMDGSNRVLLAKRTKGNAKFRGMYEFPGGKVSGRAAWRWWRRCLCGYGMVVG
jgi:hypothetical protein